MPSSRRGEEVKWWLIGVLVLAVLVLVALLLVRHLLVVPDLAPSVPPAPPPQPPSAAPTPSPVTDPRVPRLVQPAAGPLLPSSGAGDVFVQSATAVYRVELRTGRVTRTPTPALEQFSSFVAGRGWVVFKSVDDDTGVVVRNGRPATPLPAGLHPAGRLHAAPGGDLWLAPEEPTRGAHVVTRVDINGHPMNGETIRLPEELGTLRSDGAGYLISENAGGVYQHRPSGPRRLTSGELIAVGANHLLVWDCDKRARCNAYRVDRSQGRRTMLPVDHEPIPKLYQSNPDDASAFGGDLSPDATHAALRVPGEQPDAWPLAVLNLATGETHLVPGSMTDTNGNTQLAWTTNSRWLLTITDHQMRGYDTITDTTRTITFTNEPLLHLTMIGATGN